MDLGSEVGSPALAARRLRRLMSTMSTGISIWETTSGKCWCIQRSAWSDGGFSPLCVSLRDDVFLRNAWSRQFSELLKKLTHFLLCPLHRAVISFFSVFGAQLGPSVVHARASVYGLWRFSRSACRWSSDPEVDSRLLTARVLVRLFGALCTGTGPRRSRPQGHGPQN